MPLSRLERPFARRTLVTTTETPRARISTWRSEHTISYEEAFERELVEFHEAVTTSREPRTPARDGLRDVAICQSWVRAALSGAPVAAPSRLEPAPEVGAA